MALVVVLCGLGILVLGRGMLGFLVVGGPAPGGWAGGGGSHLLICVTRSRTCRPARGGVCDVSLQVLVAGVIVVLALVCVGPLGGGGKCWGRGSLVVGGAVLGGRAGGGGSHWLICIASRRTRRPARRGFGDVSVRVSLFGGGCGCCGGACWGGGGCHLLICIAGSRTCRPARRGVGGVSSRVWVWCFFVGLVGFGAMWCWRFGSEWGFGVTWLSAVRFQVVCRAGVVCFC